MDNHHLHFALDAVGMRAQATAVGLVQLSIELREAGLLGQPAFDRIKASIADEISASRSRAVDKAAFEADLRKRLDRIFEGAEPVGKLPLENA